MKGRLNKFLLDHLLVSTPLQQLKGPGLVGLRREVSIVGKDAPPYSCVSKRTRQVVHSPLIGEEGGLSFIKSNQHYEFIC
ncbi:hypothetical protein COCOBI_pt-1700 (chloroplast) [Coccomyxa sp. Obi]|nr:hypothetical protein COCOBI_pt-1700 [Coccomyxa sp. Obi]